MPVTETEDVIDGVVTTTIVPPAVLVSGFVVNPVDFSIILTKIGHGVTTELLQKRIFMIQTEDETFSISDIVVLTVDTVKVSNYSKDPSKIIDFYLDNPSLTTELTEKTYEETTDSVGSDYLVLLGASNGNSTCEVLPDGTIVQYSIDALGAGHGVYDAANRQIIRNDDIGVLSAGTKIVKIIPIFVDTTPTAEDIWYSQFTGPYSDPCCSAVD